MTSLYPWLAVASVGALHGLNPATGWMFAAAWGWRSHDRRRALRALIPIAAGHAASVALVAAVLMFGLSVNREAMQWIAGGLAIAAAVIHLACRESGAACAPAGHAARPS
ncbi:hypothetical protein [Noviherbaspirillum aerium]|uniref:hypothetical protein n=1 Tax=Noviherbaspirillum aerium TaxID=2588497 RepID=UPI00298FCFBE|nr:hypothetical protein [Noviherbaspirillum aerium]